MPYAFKVILEARIYTDSLLKTPTQQFAHLPFHHKSHRLIIDSVQY